jgi:hypothetical protein
VKVDEDEDGRCTVCLEVAIDVSSINIGHDVLDGSERSFDVRRVVHCKEDSGNDLQGEEEAHERTVASVVVKICGSRVVEHVIGQEILYGFVSIHRASEEGSRARIVKHVREGSGSEQCSFGMCRKFLLEKVHGRDFSWRNYKQTREVFVHFRANCALGAR